MGVRYTTLDDIWNGILTILAYIVAMLAVIAGFAFSAAVIGVWFGIVWRIIKFVGGIL
jgi:small-conductance mechanosensitive channel